MCVYFNILSHYITYGGVHTVYIYIRIYTLASPSSLLQDISVTPLSNTSFMITWSRSDPNYCYSVIWTDQNTDMMNSFTVQNIENSHTVTGLSDDANYVVYVAAVGICGNTTSPKITVYGKYLGALLYMHTYVC